MLLACTHVFHAQASPLHAGRGEIRRGAASIGSDIRPARGFALRASPEDGRRSVIGDGEHDDVRACGGGAPQSAHSGRQRIQHAFRVVPERGRCGNVRGNNGGNGKRTSTSDIAGRA